jgi:ABC-type Zn uptake system ZnuABC Zn-binding protein ZnuA
MIKLGPHISFLALLFLALAVTACGSGEDSGGVGDLPAPAEGEVLRVVATTGIVGDVVANVGGDLIDLTVLLPPGTDPHAYEPTPQDVAAVADAHLLFANGLDLEEFLDPMLESAGARSRTVFLSEGVTSLEPVDDEDHDEGADEHEHGKVDPHVWTDPHNVMLWADRIASALGEHDPENAPKYQSSAEAYRARLEELDTWITEQLELIPASDRRLVTDHGTLNYFCDRYGLEFVGAIIPGYSSMAEPSARELAEMEDAIRELGVKAVFVGNTVNPALAETVAQDTGTRLIFIYTGSLSEPGGGADSYLAYMRSNVDAIVNALR